MLKNIILLLIICINCSVNEQSKKPTYIYYDEVNKLFKKNISKSKLVYHIKGFDFYQSRYVIPYDEKKKNILKIYEKNNFKNITTLFSFSNLKKDTIYVFPLTDSEEFSVFGERYKDAINGHIDEEIDIYFKIYDNKLAIIDSIR